MGDNSSEETVLVVRDVFAEWLGAKVTHVVIRGWTGQEIVGSDIDVLLTDESFVTAMAILQANGFQRVTRGWQLWDFLARELYFDKEIGSMLIRFHLCNRLLFGKPARRIRFPIEAEVIRQAVLDPDVGCYVLVEPWRYILDIYRIIIDKPAKTGQLFSPNVPEESSISKAVRDSLNYVLIHLEQFQAGIMSETELRREAIISLSHLPGSEFHYRAIQTMLSTCLMLPSRVYGKVAKLARQNIAKQS